MPRQACGREPESAPRRAGGAAAGAGREGRVAGRDGLDGRTGGPRLRRVGGWGARAWWAGGPPPPPLAFVGLSFAPSRCEIETGAPGGALCVRSASARCVWGGSLAPLPAEAGLAERPEPQGGGLCPPSRLTSPWISPVLSVGRVLEIALSGRGRRCRVVTLWKSAEGQE